MTQNIEKADPRVAAVPGRYDHRATPPKWWSRPWIIPLLAVALGFLTYQINQFWGVWGTNKAAVSPHPGFSAYWTLLGGHMIGGFTAMFTAVLQVWPWIRRHHPRIHRISGRIYVVAALVSGTCALSIVRFAPPAGRIGIILATIMWMSTAVIGFFLAWRGKFVLHRRFMLYSFATLMSIVWGVVIVRIGMKIHKMDMVYLNYLIESSRWVAWVINLIAVQWFLLRTPNQPLNVPGSKGTRPIF